MAVATPLKTIPTIPGQPILGNLREVRQKEILRFAEDLRSNYGPIAWVKMGPIQMCFVCEPEHLHHIFVKNAKNYVKGPGYDRLRLLLGNGLVTSDGEVWRQERRLAQPTFTPKAVLDFHEMMVQVTQQIIERWQPLVGQTIHMDEEMMRLTMG